MVGFKIVKDTTITGNTITSGLLKTTSTTTGALQVEGGAQIFGNFNVGGTHSKVSQFSSTIRWFQFGVQSFSGIGSPVNIRNRRVLKHETTNSQRMEMFSDDFLKYSEKNRNWVEWFRIVKYIFDKIKNLTIPHISQTVTFPYMLPTRS